MTIDNTVETRNSRVVTTDNTIVTTDRGINTTTTRATNTHKSHYKKCNQKNTLQGKCRLSCVVNAPLECSDISDNEDNPNDQDSPTPDLTKKLDFPSQNLNTMPENLGGNDFQEKVIRQASCLVHNAIIVDVET